MILIEAVLVVGSVIVAFLFPTAAAGFWQKLENRFVALSRRRALSVTMVGLLAIAARLAVLPLLPVPNPGIPDEFGHLLAADTFAHFRLTNPTHPMWVHFENLSEIQQPSYASKYPPAQGLVLAFGQIVFGHPFWGVCLSLGVMCAAICWMLQAWLPPPWALLGGVLAVIRLAMFSYWGNSYWGGAVAATGGALVLGAFPRIKAAQRPRDVVIMVFGLAILANSRPYEGLVLSIPILVALFVWLLKSRGLALERALMRVAVPFVACCGLTAIMMGYYNWRVTGNPARTPYQVAQATYYATPLFLFQKLPPTPMYHHPALKAAMQSWEVPVYEGGRAHPVLMAEARVFFLCLFFYGPALALPFLLLPYVLPHDFSWSDLNSETRLLLIVVAVSLLGAMLPLFFNPGYAAPLTAALYALLLKALRRVRAWNHSRATGIAFARYLMVSCLVLVFIRIEAKPLHLQLYGPRTWSSLDFQLTERARLEAQLSRSSDRNLVIIRDPANELRRGTEWVFNDADIDGSKVVWARDMGPEQNAELIRYFRGRKVWSVQPDSIAPTLSPYTDLSTNENSAYSAATVK